MAARIVSLAAALGLVAALACGRQEAAKPPSSSSAPAPSAGSAEPQPAAEPPDLPRGLLLALSQFEVSPEGKVLPKPGPARLEILTRRGGQWQVEVLEDPESNVFHKAMAYDGGILTLGGTAAKLKLWRKRDGHWQAETLWEKDFGGAFSRMRDAEAADLFGDGRPALAVATHDQGVVATVRPKLGGGWEVQEIDHEKDTFVHEIEIGDLDGDGVPEVYATPSEPNRLDGTAQKGVVTRYVPRRGEGRTVVADLGDRHAKEILVGDVDGDGRDELYVSVEARTEGSGDQIRIAEPVEIRRYDAGTDPKGGVVIATLDDRLCRFLTAGDIDGDGKREMVAAGFKSGLWLLRPGPDPHQPWTVTSIDRNSSGFEHAAKLADLDGDGRDELYVASDDQGEVRRYVWRDGHFEKEVIHRRPVAGSAFTFNIEPVPVELLR
ncbi:MAG TPA: VCBS repeat-containing protein [Myxococcota bacterium]|nr:VCBS repeat-containing protein [Myxococcota bacterium]